MDNISISVIIPCYNVAPYLEECMASAIRQTQENIEIICIDDCSTDETFSLLEALALRHDVVHLHRHEYNRGLSATRNTGLRHARGEFVFFLDADDVLPDPMALRVLFQAAIEDNADEVIGRTLRWWPESGILRQANHTVYQAVELRKTHITQHPELHRNVIAWNKLIRRAFLEEHNMRFDEELRKFEDNIFSCALHMLSRASSYIKRTTYWHRQRAGGEPSLRQNKENIDYQYYYAVFKFYVTFFSSYPEFFYIYAKSSSIILKNTILCFSNFPRSESEICNFIDSLHSVIDISPRKFIPLYARKIFKSYNRDNYSNIYNKLIRLYTTPQLFLLKNSN